MNPLLYHQTHTWSKYISSPGLNTIQYVILVTQHFKALGFLTCFWGISWLCFAFIFLGWLKLAHIYIQVSTLHNGGNQGINQQIFNTFTASLNQAVHAKTTGSQLALRERKYGAESGRELFKCSKDSTSLVVCTQKKFFACLSYPQQ